MVILKILGHTAEELSLEEMLCEGWVVGKQVLALLES